MDPIKAFEVIEGELAAFSETLTHKPRIVVATKLDATTDRRKLEELRRFCEERGLAFHAISAPTGEGVKELVRGIADALEKIPKEGLDEVTDGEEAKIEGVEESEAPEMADGPENDE
jgi:GTPase